MSRTRKNKKSVNKRLGLILLLEILLFIGLVVGYAFYLFNSKMDLMVTDTTPKEEIDVSDAVTETMETTYTTIALFGLDTREKNANLTSSGVAHSDAVIIVSINNDTKEVRMASVYRDCFMEIAANTSTTQKFTHAYLLGGPTCSVETLNRNLDLNIKDYVAVDFEALTAAIDALGGVWVDVDKEELKHINNYQQSIIRDVASLANYEIVKVTQTGNQLLNGLQASAYCRIRQTSGDDFKRAERQREVIKAMTEKAQNANLDTLLEVVKAVAPNVYSTFDLSDTAKMTELLKNITKYKIVEEGGFPTEELRTTGNIGAEGSCVIPLSLEANVVELHRFLFGEENYEVSDEVKECSQTVTAKTAPYLK